MAQGAPLIALQAVSSIVGGASDAGTLRRNAAVDAENARLAELDGALREENIRRDERRTSGEAIAAIGESGVLVGTGSALDILRQNAIEREYAAISARREAAGQAAALRQQAADKRAEATSALIKGFVGAGAAVLAGDADRRNQARVDAATDKLKRTQLPGSQRMPVPQAGGLYTGG